MRNYILTLIYTGFALSVALGQWFFKRSWYKVYLILILMREISVGFASSKGRREVLH